MKPQLLEPPGADPHAGWCGRGGTYGFPPIPIGIDLETYAVKLMRKAELLVHYRESEVLGIAAFYCNDLETLCGFLSLMWVSPEARGSGIAGELLDLIISTSEVRRFRCLKLEVLIDNHRAINFYRRHGFEVIDTKNEALIMGLELPRRQASNG